MKRKPIRIWPHLSPVVLLTVIVFIGHSVRKRVGVSAGYLPEHGVSLGAVVTEDEPVAFEQDCPRELESDEAATLSTITAAIFTLRLTKLVRSERHTPLVYFIFPRGYGGQDRGWLVMPVVEGLHGVMDSIQEVQSDKLVQLPGVVLHLLGRFIFSHHFYLN